MEGKVREVDDTWMVTVINIRMKGMLRNNNRDWDVTVNGKRGLFEVSVKTRVLTKRVYYKIKGFRNRLYSYP